MLNCLYTYSWVSALWSCWLKCGSHWELWKYCRLAGHPGDWGFISGCCGKAGPGAAWSSSWGFRISCFWKLGLHSSWIVSAFREKTRNHFFTVTSLKQCAFGYKQWNLQPITLEAQTYWRPNGHNSKHRFVSIGSVLSSRNKTELTNPQNTAQQRDCKQGQNCKFDNTNFNQLHRECAGSKKQTYIKNGIQKFDTKLWQRAGTWRWEYFVAEEKREDSLHSLLEGSWCEQTRDDKQRAPQTLLSSLTHWSACTDTLE